MNNKNYFDLISLIEKELLIIEKLVEEIKPYHNDSNMKRIKGSILHDFYNACERIFKWIAKDINGDFSPLEQWHKELLFRMTVDIKDVRPPVISEELAAEINEFLQFRHLFRNIYGFELKSDLLDRLVDKFDNTAERFIKEIRIFLQSFKD
ncbi:MAG: hypothetical protein HY999_06050 [Nitrospinae bacterium]|nr:hypothetical protein [Nitrospinota bacterium]